MLGDKLPFLSCLPAFMLWQFQMPQTGLDSDEPSKSLQHLAAHTLQHSSTSQDSFDAKAFSTETNTVYMSSGIPLPTD